MIKIARGHVSSALPQVGLFYMHCLNQFIEVDEFRYVHV